MNKYIYLVVLFFFLIIDGFSQSEIKVYLGFKDFPGFSYEYTFKNNLGIEMSGSYRSTEIGTWYDLKQRENNLFINGAIKKYEAGKKGKSIRGYGTYIRYWQYYNYAVNATQLPLPGSIQSLLDSNLTVTYAIKSQKISIGFTSGFKIIGKKKFTFGINSGIGIALPFLYREKTFTYNYPVQINRSLTDEYYGNVNFMSVFAQIYIGYQFGKANSENVKPNKGL